MKCQPVVNSDDQFLVVYGAKDFMGYPQMANVIRNDDGGTLFSDKPSFSDVVAWMEAANISISMVHKMILGFFSPWGQPKNNPACLLPSIFLG